MYKMVGSVWRLISCYFRLLLYCTVLFVFVINRSRLHVCKENCRDCMGCNL